jgi:hypothetical protein
MIMGFLEKVQRSIFKEIQFQEGACGITHLILREISGEGGKIVSYEIPEGAYSQIFDNQGKLIGEGKDIVWPPSILKAQINAGLLPDNIEDELMSILASKKDMVRVSQMFGYGRCVTPAGLAISMILNDGGSVEIKRNGLAISAKLYNTKGKLLSEGASAFCPICAINLSVSKSLELAKKIRENLKNSKNTGKLNMKETWKIGSDGRKKEYL